MRLSFDIFLRDLQTSGLNAIFQPLFLFLYQKPRGALRELEQTGEFSNSYWRKSYIAAGVEPVAIPNLDLLETANDDLAPPAVFCFPFEGQMALGRSVYLHNEININLERTSLIVK